MLEFLSMGGYAAFVWPSWITGVVVMLCITMISRARTQATRRKLDQLQQILSDQERSS